MDKCAACGATLYGNAEWCGQCYARVERGAPSPFGSRASVSPSQASVADAAPSVPPWARGSVVTEAPPATPAAPPPWARPVDPFPPVVAPPSLLKHEAKQAEGKVAGPLGLILAIGFLFQVGAYAYARFGNVEPSTVIRVGMYVSLGFYALVLGIVVGTARKVDFAPLWSRGAAAEGVAVGGFGGVLTAALLLLLLRGPGGRLQVAPDVKLMLGDATVFSIFLCIAVAVVAAPVVEELLFRGFVAEAMRHRGAILALLVSGVLFALWHMRMGGLVYYTVLGVLLGVVYWKRGLSSSMAAHAAFNGTLVVVALAFIVGQGTVLAADGVRLEVPGGWTEASAEEMQGIVRTTPTAVLVAGGPSGSVLIVERVPVPGAGGLPLTTVVDALNSGAISLPGLAFRQGTARTVEYPAGRGIRFEIEAQGREGWAATFGQGDTLWTLTLTTAGSGRAKGDFEDMLGSLTLP